jgi:tetratricopeptide (TPR) repeat protein
MTDTIDRYRLTEQAEQAQRDLDELAQQVADGEIDDETATRLREAYRAELEAAERALAQMSYGEPATEAPGGSKRRTLVGAGVLIAAVAITIGVVGSFAQNPSGGPLEGVAAASGGTDLSKVSNEQMEAVIASYKDDPAVAGQLPLMEFALAERYFTGQDYTKAFGHYNAIIQNPNTPPPTLQAALTRVGWMVWTLNGETDLALSTLDKALEIDASNPETLYVKGQILWCGAGKPDEAVPLFEQVAAIADLPSEVLDQVRTDLQVAKAGGACS